MSDQTFEDSGPPSDRERSDQWHQTLYSKLDAMHSLLKGVQIAIYAIVAVVAIAVARHW